MSHENATRALFKRKLNWTFLRIDKCLSTNNKMNICVLYECASGALYTHVYICL